MHVKPRAFLLLLTLLVFPAFVKAVSPASITYEGTLTTSAGDPVDLSGRQINFSIVDSGTCVLYSETSTSAGDSSGNVSHAVGSGTVSFGSMSATIFNKSSSGQGGCTASPSSPRSLQVSVPELAISVTVPLTSVPYALEATSVGSYQSSNLLAAPGVDVTPLTSAQVSELFALLLGTSTNYLSSGSPTFTAAPKYATAPSTGDTLTNKTYVDSAISTALTTPGNISANAITSGTLGGNTSINISGSIKTAGTVSVGTYNSTQETTLLSILNAAPAAYLGALWVNSDSNEVKYWDGSTAQVLRKKSTPVALSEIDSSGASTGQVLKWNGSAWLPAADAGLGAETDPTVQSFAKNAPAPRFVTTGSVLDLAASGVTAGSYGASNKVPVVTVDAFGRVTGVTSTTITGVSPVGAALNAAQFWLGDASNVAAAVSLSGDASLFNNGALTINKLQGQNLTLAANPGAGALLTYNTSFSRWEALALPDCTASETLGFNAVSGNYECQTINNATNFTGSLVGDVTGTQGATTVSRLQGQTLRASSPTVRDTLVYNGSAWVNANIPSCGANQYLTFNGSYFCGTDSGAAGVVTSVDVAVPSFMSRTGGPITTSGTISLGLQNQNANLVFAGPVSGGAAAPSFRSLASEDIPALDAAKISTGTLPVSRGGTGSSAALTNGKVMISSGGAIVEGSAFGSTKVNNSYVVRDSSGGFEAGAVTVDSALLKAGTGTVTLQAPSSLTSSYTLTLPLTAGAENQMLISNGSGNLSWATPNQGTLKSVASSNAYLSVLNGTSAATLTLNVGTTANTVAAGDDARITGALQRSGGTMSGVLNMGGQDLENTGHIGMAASKYLGMGQFAADPATGGWGATEKGRTWFNTATNEIKYWDGASVRTLGVSGSGLQNLNGLSANNQSFAVGTAGTDFGITSSGSVHTFNLPTASASNRGLLSSSDFTTFTNKLSSSSQFAGDVSGTVDAITVNRLRGTNVSVSSLASGEFLKYNGSAWVNKSLISSDITTALTYTPVNKAGDTMSGALNLNNNDLTAVASVHLKGSTTGTLTLAAPLSVASYTLRFPSAVGSAGQVLATDATGNLSWAANPANSFVQNGNSFGGPAVLGTNDSQALMFETSSLTRLTIDSAGNVGIGTTSPGHLLDVSKAQAAPTEISIENRHATAASGNSADIVFKGYRDVEANYPLAKIRMLPTASTGAGNNAHNGNLTFMTAGYDSTLTAEERMRIDWAGNVGIGVTYPTSILDISGAQTMRGMAAPTLSSAGQGRIYFDSTTNKYKVSENGSAYVDLLGGGGGVGMPANALPIYQVRVATTANITLSGTQTIDGVAVVAGDRVLVKNQTTASQNGVYVVAAGAWTRASDMDVWSKVVGSTVRVNEGTAWAGMTYTSAGTVGGTLDITTINWNAAGSGNPSQSNTANGYQTLYSNTTGSANTSQGYQALFSNMTGHNNTANGYGALFSNKARSESTAIGYNSMYYAHNSTTVSTSFNTALGAYSLRGSTAATSNTGVRNTALGHSALLNMTSGSGNVGIGTSAGSAITIGSNNIVIGSNDGSSIATSSNNILIADGAGNERLRVNNSGNVGIGTTAPSSILDINGAQTMRGMAAPAVSAAGQGRIYFDSTANKYKVSENGGAYVDLLSAGGGGSLSSLTAATATNTIDSLNFAQGWNWSTATTQTAMSINANALTTGGILSLASSSTSMNSTNGLLYVANTGASTSGMVLRAQSNSTAGSGLSVLASGNVGIGTTNPVALLDVNGSIKIGSSTVACGPSGIGLGSIRAGSTTLEFCDGFSWQFLMKSDPASVVGALGYTPLNRAGDTMTGSLTVTDKIFAGGNIKSAGQMHTNSFAVSNSSIDWNSGNSGTTSFDCSVGNPINFTNLKDGGSYTLVVTGSGTGQCNFSPTITHTDGAAGTESVSYRFRPQNAERFAASHTLYTFTRVGGVVYVSWSTGF